LQNMGGWGYPPQLPETERAILDFAPTRA
jgi:hypothetical protein